MLCEVVFLVCSLSLGGWSSLWKRGRLVKVEFRKLCCGGERKLSGYLCASDGLFEVSLVGGL